MGLVDYQAMTTKNIMRYITRQAREWAVSVSGVYFIDVEVPCIVKKNGKTLRSRDTTAQHSIK